MNKDTLVIGISGCSCSGKTSIGKLLNSLLNNSVVIHQDEYYKLDQYIPKDSETGYDNWDIPEAIEMDQFYNEIVETINRGLNNKGSTKNESVNSENSTKAGIIEEIKLRNKEVLTTLNKQYKKTVIVEGFLFFHEERFLKLITKGFLIWTNFDTLLQRRNSRDGYETKEGFWKDPENYFEKIVWPSFLKYYSKFIRYNQNDISHNHEPFGLALVDTNPPHTVSDSVTSLLNQLI
ncbi:P-loop containing nucleoside triphosphate hydrolase protein [Neoconidiobolus thromboides FSU 785]|nr:P-loop containing nucleoside triphosphate hydrolase protein [Neoconidiobolus thromboides FSU 785]